MGDKIIGILTGGGDCPGLNPAIKGATLKAIKLGYQVMGIKDGWKGLIEGEYFPLDKEKVEGLMNKGGTILGTSRTNPFKVEQGVEKALANLQKISPDGLIAMGGEDTLGVANRLYLEYSIKVVGAPKTMDNDLGGTDLTFGFDSAVTRAVDALGALKDTGNSHHRIMILEVMGRHAGWVALYTAIAGEANAVLLPEEKPNIDELLKHLKEVYQIKKTASIVISEGVELPGVKGEEELDQFGHMILKKRGVGDRLANIIEKELNIETRVGVIGHMQRGGSPTIFDRILGVRTGVKAAELIAAGKFGRMAILKGSEIADIPLAEGVAKLKMVTPEWISLAKTILE